MFTLFMSLSMIMLQIDFVMGILIHFNFLLQLFERPLIFLDFCVFKEAVCFSGKKNQLQRYTVCHHLKYIIHHWCHFQRC